jgi:serine phosphatase RsbU (regulator of sigma subunit)
MGIMKNQLIEELIENENAIEVVNQLSKESARIELEVDMARARERERIQMEMYDDPYMNWSGQR